MKKTAFVLVAAAAATLAGRASAQVPLPTLTPFSVEARGGLSVPTGDLKDVAKTGWTAGASITYHALPLFGVYAGFSADQWNSKIGSGSARESGLDVGARLSIPTPLIPIDPWIKAGAVFHNVKISGSADPADDFTTNRKWGWQVGGGLGFTLGPKVSVTPGVTYTHLKSNSEFGGTLQHVRADIGLRVRI
jgi:opacity protein-like surface antigen